MKSVWPSSDDFVEHTKKKKFNIIFFNISLNNNIIDLCIFLFKWISLGAYGYWQTRSFKVKNFLGYSTYSQETIWRVHFTITPQLVGI